MQTFETAAARLRTRRRAAVLDGRVLALAPTGIEVLRLLADAAQVAIARLRQAAGTRDLVRIVVGRGCRLAVVEPAGAVG